MALFRRRTRSESEERANYPYSLSQLAADLEAGYYGGGPIPITFSYGGNTYSTGEDIAGSFEGYVQGAYRTNGVVFACMLARLAVFSDVRFVFREINNGTPGDTYAVSDGRNPASSGLNLLRNPWVGGTTGDLLARMIQDADLSGNAFIVRRQGQLVRLRPDWVSIAIASPGSIWHPDAEVAGYVYKPGGPQTDDEPIAFVREEVAHFAPVPDPIGRFRGQSWLEPVMLDISSDKAATLHKKKFFEQGATVNLAITYDKELGRDLFQFAVDSFKTSHEGVQNAHKVLHLLGATVTPVGTDMQQVDMKNIQGALETRIAAAAGVPPIIVGLSEGLAAATYSNYGQARRAFADRTIRPLWRNVCGSLAQIITAPTNAELWYDDADVAFLREDMKDAADIRLVDAQTINTLVTAGFTPQSATDAVVAGDMRRLSHTGLVSVQLNKPGQQPPEPKPPQQPMMPADAGQNAMRDITRAIGAQQMQIDFLGAQVSRMGGPDVHVHVPTPPETQVHVGQPEVRVDVQPADVHVEPRFEMPEVSVQPQITVEAPEAPDVTVNVDTAPITVQVPEQRAPDVHMEPQITVEAPNVTVQPPDIHVAAPQVEVAAPEVHVAAPEAPDVTVNVDAPQITVQPERHKRRSRRKVLRDEQGNITSVEDEEDGLRTTHRVLRDEEGNIIGIEDEDG